MPVGAARKTLALACAGALMAVALGACSSDEGDDPAGPTAGPDDGGAVTSDVAEDTGEDTGTQDAAAESDAAGSDAAGTDAAGADAAGETGAPDSTATSAPPEAAYNPDLPAPPGELVDVDGHTMHLYCAGEGSPTVLLDAGLGDTSVNFWPLQAQLTGTVRVCSYDRAGYGWSQPGPEPRSIDQIVTELGTLLDNADEEGPFVLVGHSFGGLTMLAFAQANPEDTAGVVLVDSSHPNQGQALAAVPAVVAVQEAEIAGLARLATAIEAGVSGPDELRSAAPELPSKARELWALHRAQPESLETAVAEYAALEEGMAAVGGPGALGDTPLVVIARGIGLEGQLPPEALGSVGLTPEVLDRFDTIWRGLQEDLLTLSSNSELVVAEDSTHYVYLDEPDVVLAAIEQVLAESS
ncbi:alpha/beta hydrolase [Ornithinimicrobium sp. F0845]|uniref:alpha/beta hydrolase n=1 Tax=Ornithinimicrobium sp. F0845 TaxID=2926412 RepID=UPI001FF0E1E9|nr:alpha/beta hydrolase [Ornithinimicrobium sp. F0845]MCK0112722.1 alpha/beta hydrolase [Ornithinimicrobium sp. F0845]